MSVHAPRGDERRDHGAELTDRMTERSALDRLAEAVRAGQSQALAVRGDPGVGKTVLLEYLAGRAGQAGCQVVARGGRAVGDGAGLRRAASAVRAAAGSARSTLPAPQRDALRTAFGLAAGPPPDRFLVGPGRAQPAVRGGRRTSADLPDRRRAVARPGLGAGAGVRRPGGWRQTRSGWCSRPASRGQSWPGCPSWKLTGCGTRTRGRCWRGRWPGRWTTRVRDLIIAETRGNPLALLELPRGLSPAELAGGFGLPGRGAADRPDRGQLPPPAGRPAGPDPAAPAAGGGRPVR